MDKSEIKDLIKERNLLISQKPRSGKVDEIEQKIVDEFRSNDKKYEVDFIVESLTYFGDCPSLLYDDNGYFCFGGGGMQPVSLEEAGVEGYFTIETKKKYWRKTIRLALKEYLMRRKTFKEMKK